MSLPAIKIEHLGKEFRIGQRERYLALRDLLTSAAAAPFRAFQKSSSNGTNGAKRTIWALRDVSFEVQPGEAVGLIGRNGAGKTTLLKVLAQITKPTTGHAEVRGRIGSLLEVGTGFHPELTGRENAYLSGAILGMRKQEIDRKFDEIVAFSGVEQFIDTPLKHYSSGMQMRLAFAVAAHLEPEILLVDEVLAVGDMEFQKKCLGKMEEVSRHGRTVIFVSHNMGAIRRLCARGVWLDGGQVRRLGTAAECIDAYSENVSAAEHDDSGVWDLASRTDRPAADRIRFRAVRLTGTDGVNRGSFEFGEPFAINFEVACKQSVGSSFVGITILAADGTTVVGTHQSDSTEMRNFEAGKTYRLACLFDPNMLKPGVYFLQIAILDYATWDCHDVFHSAGQFTIVPGSGKFGRSPDERPAYVQPLLKWEWR